MKAYLIGVCLFFCSSLIGQNYEIEKHIFKELSIYKFSVKNIGVSCNIPGLIFLDEIEKQLDSNSQSLVLFHFDKDEDFPTNCFYHVKFRDSSSYILYDYVNGYNKKIIQYSEKQKDSLSYNLYDYVDSSKTTIKFSQKQKDNLFHFPNNEIILYYFKVKPIDWEVGEEILYGCRNDGLIFFEGTQIKYFLLATGNDNIMSVGDMCYELQEPIITQHYFNLLRLLDISEKDLYKNFYRKMSKQ